MRPLHSRLSFPFFCFLHRKLCASRTLCTPSTSCLPVLLSSPSPSLTRRPTGWAGCQVPVSWDAILLRRHWTTAHVPSPLLTPNTPHLQFRMCLLCVHTAPS
eukprot:GGOE01060785.1.p5 GENE.GGOE01060785.1~~GGOE01060785.1.p5  ORF type:complete len:102 (-),score=6.38 GGOE01060785.1:145-450(-)